MRRRLARLLRARDQGAVAHTTMFLPAESGGRGVLSPRLRGGGGSAYPLMVSTRVRVTHCTARPRQALAHYPELFTLPPHCVLGLGVSEPAHAEHLAMTSTWVEEQGASQKASVHWPQLGWRHCAATGAHDLKSDADTCVASASVSLEERPMYGRPPTTSIGGLERELSGRVASWPGIDTPRYVWNSTSSRMGWCRERPTCDLLDILCRIWLI